MQQQRERLVLAALTVEILIPCNNSQQASCHHPPKIDPSKSKAFQGRVNPPLSSLSQDKLLGGLYITKLSSKVKDLHPLPSLPSGTRMNPLHLPLPYSDTTKNCPCLLEQRWARKAGKPTLEQLQNYCIPSSRTNSSTVAYNQDISTLPNQKDRMIPLHLSKILNTEDPPSTANSNNLDIPNIANGWQISFL
ncbi:hypothetical protein FH972_006299 [Carpinus fangiana]|uniref:Uncharacterized protein n=1 Tax=Carpinus fangiana TaxID=176857 RepID=A0A5N6QUU0_9ROSI|nr:hypothetical protein FH972_006299 [Carpinus fangiana]